MRGSRLILALLAALILALVALPFFDPELPALLWAVAVQSGERLRESFFDKFLMSPFFHLGVAAILVLELLLPVERDRPLLPKGLVVDALWLPLTLFFALATPFYVLLCQHLFMSFLGFLRLGAVADLPEWLRFVLALLAGDFFNYVGHLVRHKVPALWHFHAVHHAQRELNLFTENRVHPFDNFFHHLIAFIPMLMLEPRPADLVAILWLRHWHQRFCHANVRTNLGPLRYLLVTPQSHRVHHSLDPAHHDSNYGVTFSLWDHLFGTQHRDYEVYPECGIDDPDFPFEQEGRSPLAALAAQFWYPFTFFVGRKAKTQ